MTEMQMNTTLPHLGQFVDDADKIAQLAHVPCELALYMCVP
jgi:hypothetical protein